jgi:hypothetical protein
MTAPEPSDGDDGTGATEQQAGVGSRSDAHGRTGDRHCVAAWAGFGAGDSAHTDERHAAGSKAENHSAHQDCDSRCVFGKMGTASLATQSGAGEKSRIVPGQATAHLQRESAGVLPHARWPRVPGSAPMCLLRSTGQDDSARASGECRPSETGRRSRSLHLRPLRSALRRDLRGRRPSRWRLTGRDRPYERDFPCRQRHGSHSFRNRPRVPGTLQSNQLSTLLTVATLTIR